MADMWLFGVQLGSQNGTDDGEGEGIPDVYIRRGVRGIYPCGGIQLQGNPVLCFCGTCCCGGRLTPNNNGGNCREV